MSEINVIIAGLGLIGGSLAACWSAQGISVTGVARQASTLALARQRGWIADGYLSLADSLRPNSWLVLCGPLSLNVQWLKNHAQTINALPGLYVTDVGSCKRRIMTLADELIPGRFIGGHPMAGKAVTGLEHAEATLFKDRPYLLCPTPDIPEAAALELKQLINLTGGNCQEINPSTHDRMMAWVSHLPQLYSLLLAKGLQDTWGDAPLYHGPALTEHLRLSTSAYSVWKDIFEENADNIAAAWTVLSHLGAQATCDPEFLQQLWP